MKKYIYSSAIIFFIAAVSGCNPYNNEGEGAATGGALGMLAGGIIGNQSHNAATGMLIGGAVGAVTGAALAANSIMDVAINSNAISTRHIVAGAIFGYHLAAGTIDGTRLVPGAVGTSNFGILPAVRVYKTQYQTLTQNVDTVLTWEGEEFDTNSLHDTPNSRLKAPVAGYYQVNLLVEEEDDGFVGAYQLTVRKNGSDIVGADHGSQNAAGNSRSKLSLKVSTLVKLEAGEFVDARLNLNVPNTYIQATGTLNQATHFTMHWVGPR